MSGPSKVKLAPCVKVAWISEHLAIDDAAAKKIGAALSDDNPEWGGVKDKATFAETYLDNFVIDPNLGIDCRNALGKGASPLFAIPAQMAKKVPADSSAKKALGVFAATAREFAEQGDHKEAIEYAAIELLEYGAYAEPAFELAHEIQHLKNYKELVQMAQTVEQLGLASNLVEEGLEPAEAAGEAQAKVQRSYSVALLITIVEGTADEENNEKQVKALQDASASLAAAARATAAHLQISSAPLGTDSALAMLDESITIIEEHLEGSEDENLFKQAKLAKDAAAACKKHLIGRAEACEARLLAKDVRELALEASSQADEAARTEVKNLADAKKMEKLFLKANEIALKACELAIKCAKFVSAKPKVESNDKEAEALFNSIELAFQGARKDAKEDVKARAAAAAAAQETAKAVEVEKEAKPAKAKEAAATAADAPAATSAGDAAGARQALLDGLAKFAAKRWDTNMASQTLKRLTDRRKEVIGQLWESVENNEGDALRRAEKFVEQFRNTMDARRRLDAVVRLIGRGQPMDVRTAKWFTDSILDLATLARGYCEASGVKVQ